MPLLEYLRNKAAILVAVVIGFALFAFVAGDLFMSGNSVFSANEMEVGRVGRKSLDYVEFQSDVDYFMHLQTALGGAGVNTEAMNRQVRERIWEKFVQDEVMGRFSARTGLTVTNEELSKLIMGNEPHPIVRQLFSNPNTGEFDESQVVLFLQNLDVQATPEQRAYWLEMEGEIAGEQLMSKFSTLVERSVGYPMPLVQYEETALGGSVNTRYMVLPYATLADSLVQYSERDLKDYYKRHRASYRGDERRDIEYVRFRVEPTEDDRAAARADVASALEGFASVDDPGMYATQNGDTPYSGAWIPREEADGAAVDWIFDTAEVGDVSPIYGNGSKFYAYRLVGRKELPDSVHARHILFSNQKYPLARANELADSLRGVLDAGESFESLALSFSDDPGSKEKGGDLGWFRPGMMVKPFNDACFEGRTGDVVIVESAFGVHLIEVLGQGGGTLRADVAELSRNVEPGSFTFQQVYQDASSFASNALEERAGWWGRLFGADRDYLERSHGRFSGLADSLGYSVSSATGIEHASREVSGLPGSREMVRWAFESDLGDASQVFELEDSYIVAIVTGIDEVDGDYLTFEAVRDEVLTGVVREKKGDQLSARLREAMADGGKSLDEVAREFGVSIRHADGISVRSYALGSEGYEPGPIGVCTSLSAGEMSGPVVGNGGVFLMEVIERAPQGTVNLDQSKERREQMVRAGLGRMGYEALKEMSKIEDNRYKFY